MPILFADDASVLISHSNPIKFKNNTIKEVLVYGLLDDWIKKELKKQTPWSESTSELY
jgi:hypothetical protein